MNFWMRSCCCGCGRISTAPPDGFSTAAVGWAATFRSGTRLSESGRP